MISKSGYVKTWIFAPLVPVVTTIVTLALKWHDTSSFLKGHSFNFAHYGVMRWVDVAGFTVGWVLFLIFAFSPWPGLGSGPGIVASARGRATSPSASRVPTPGPGLSSLPRFQAAAPTASGGASGGVDTRRRIYCPWCGDHIPGNRALGHDCGSKDRPEIICRFCGNAFPEGTTLCPTCDA